MQSERREQSSPLVTRQLAPVDEVTWLYRGLRPGLALAKDVRHRDDHDHGDDDDQNDKEHGPLLPAAPG